MLSSYLEHTMGMTNTRAASKVEGWFCQRRKDRAQELKVGSTLRNTCFKRITFVFLQYYLQEECKGKSWKEVDRCKYMVLMETEIGCRRFLDAPAPIWDQYSQLVTKP